jgi:hypothetical protein
MKKQNNGQVSHWGSEGELMKKAAQHPEAGKLTAITNARIFDGESVIDDQIVVIDGAHIHAVGGVVPARATVIDARGATLMPGLIDAHVHTDVDGLHDALLFGVTTELEMMGQWSPKGRKKIAERHDVADIRSAGMGVTPPGGHPSEYMKSSSNLLLRLFFRYPFVSTPPSGPGSNGGTWSCAIRSAGPGQGRPGRQRECWRSPQKPSSSSWRPQRTPCCGLRSW